MGDIVPNGSLRQVTFETTFSGFRKRGKNKRSQQSGFTTQPWAYCVLLLLSYVRPLSLLTTTYDTQTQIQTDVRLVYCLRGAKFKEFARLQGVHALGTSSPNKLAIRDAKASQHSRYCHASVDTILH